MPTPGQRHCVQCCSGHEIFTKKETRTQPTRVPGKGVPRMHFSSQGHLLAGTLRYTLDTHAGKWRSVNWWCHKNSVRREFSLHLMIDQGRRDGTRLEVEILKGTVEMHSLADLSVHFDVVRGLETKKIGLRGPAFDQLFSWH